MPPNPVDPPKGPGAPLSEPGNLGAIQIADHELIRKIGSGSYGEVWLARNVMGSFRGVKIIHRRTFRDDKPFDREYKGIERFEPISREHPGFVCVLHVGKNEAAGYFYYVMEVADDVIAGQKINPDTYVPKTLNSELNERQKLPPSECLDIALALTSALAHLHNSGLIHRDIKPSNIIFVSGRPKFADIGLVTEIGESATFVGTEGYVPPEGPGKPLADIYSLGKLLYELSTGKSLRHFPELPTMVDQGTEPLLRSLHEIVLKACHLNPAKRIQSADAMYQELLRLKGGERPVSATPRTVAPAPELKVALVHQANLQLDSQLATALQAQLKALRCRVQVDQHVVVGVEWAREVEKKIAEADIVLVLLSKGSVESEMVAYEVELARDTAQQRQGKPRLISVRVAYSDPLPGQLAGALDSAPQFLWHAAPDTEALVKQLSLAFQGRTAEAPSIPRPKLETVGGAVPLDSAFYIVRPGDEIFEEAVAKGDSIVLVKGARQMGKTSLLARALQLAREEGLKVMLTDFQKLNTTAFTGLEQFYLALGESVADQLDLDAFPADAWDSRRSPNINIERYLRREVLDRMVTRLVWGMDEVDRLFPCPFSGEVFGLFRSWHNKRALDPTGPWSKLTLAMAYATEAHLFITDLVQSPFNVGTRLALDDFLPEQVHELNRRYGSPLKTPEETNRLIHLLGGQPFLVRRGLHELATQRMSLDEFEKQAVHDEGFFGDHLRRILVALAKDTALGDVVRGVLRGSGTVSPEAFYRLRSSGILIGDNQSSMRPRCDLYARYLRKHLLGEGK